MMLVIGAWILLFAGTVGMERADGSTWTESVSIALLVAVSSFSILFGLMTIFS